MIARWLGIVEYPAAWRLQDELAELVYRGELDDTLLLLEHPPTLTLGRGADPAHLLASPDRLRALNVTVHEVDRGGDITYHGPGQLVGYPIFDLSRRGRDLHQYLRDIESALIDIIAEVGLTGRRFPPHTGVWIAERKIAAIGVKIRRWVSTHGFALNVNPDLSHFELIVPCGIREYPVTSLHKEGLTDVPVAALIEPTAESFRRMSVSPGSPESIRVDGSLSTRSVSIESAEIWSRGQPL